MDSSNQIDAAMGASSTGESASMRALRSAGNADGAFFNFATFYLFAQRVAWGEAKPEEIEFMGRMLDVVERRRDMDVAVNSYMGER